MHLVRTRRSPSQRRRSAGGPPITTSKVAGRGDLKTIEVAAFLRAIAGAVGDLDSAVVVLRNVDSRIASIGNS